MSRYYLVLTNVHGQTYFSKNRFNEIFVPEKGFLNVECVKELPVVDFDNRVDAINACNKYIEQYGVERCQVIDNEARELIHTSE